MTKGPPGGGPFLVTGRRASPSPGLVPGAARVLAAGRLEAGRPARGGVAVLAGALRDLREVRRAGLVPRGRGGRDEEPAHLAAVRDADVTAGARGHGGAAAVLAA